MDKPVFIRALVHFLSFAPKRILWINFLTLIQGVIGSAGVLMLIPLAQLAGVDFSQYVSQHAGIVNNLIEWINQSGYFDSLVKVLFWYVAIALLISMLSYHHAMLSVQIQQSYVRSMRLNLYRLLLQANWSFLSNRRLSDYLHRVGAQVQTMNVAANQIVGLMHQVLTMSVYTVLMLMIHWQFTVLTFVCGLIVAAIVFPVRYSVRDSGERQLRGYQEIFSTLAEHLGSLKIIKASAREPQFHHALSEISNELEEQSVRMTRAGSIISFANSMGLAIGFAVLLYIAVDKVNVPLADFFVLLMIMSRIMPQLASMQSSVQGVVFSLPSYLDIEKTMQEAQDAQEFDMSMRAERMQLQHSVKLNNVSYQYPSEKKVLFNNLNIEIEQNKTVALAGASGIGKTTIADMVASLLQPQQGELVVDGKAVNGEQMLAWRRSIAYVTQEVYLFNDSVRANLSWMSPGATQEQIWQALEMAAMADRVKQMPEQLETHIGDRGIRLSGGERQRLALARAFLVNPELLILDEATSALDDDTEQKIHQVIATLHGKMTVLIIAHRQSTLALADKVIDVAELRG